MAYMILTWIKRSRNIVKFTNDMAHCYLLSLYNYMKLYFGRTSSSNSLHFLNVRFVICRYCRFFPDILAAASRGLLDYLDVELYFDSTSACVTLLTTRRRTLGTDKHTSQALYRPCIVRTARIITALCWSACYNQ